MTRQQYITRTLRALCGSQPAHPQVAHTVSRMARTVAEVYQFDSEAESEVSQ